MQLPWPNNKIEMVLNMTMEKEYQLDIKLNRECTIITYYFKILELNHKHNTKHELELKIIKLNTYGITRA